MVLVSGDVVHSADAWETGIGFLGECALRYFTCCSLGNHEFKYGADFREQIRQTGAVLLDNDYIRKGRFVIGGPHGDAGLTGRKIIVDTYGGVARHGGGAFSGKDCTKVDRSAAYAARYVAKNMVAAGFADKMEIQVSYAIGVAQPTSISVETFGTGKVSDEAIAVAIRKYFDLRPAGIIKTLDLRRPIYRQTAAYGHFGRTDLDLPWERLDKVDVLKEELNAELAK